MMYDKHYAALIAKAQSRPKPEGYMERHHVVPRSMGGSDAPDNLVWLTAREHFVAHVLLAKMHGGSQWYAVMMFAAGEKRTVNSRLYEAAKKHHAAWMAENYSGRKLPETRRTAISMGLKGNTNTKGSTLSEEHRAAIAKSMRGNTNNAGRKASAETRAKMAAARRGRGRSEETKARIRAGVLAANAAGINPNP
jgi:hypothetical protein